MNLGKIFKRRESNIRGQKGNFVLGTMPKLENSKIVFKGNGNVFFCEDGVEICNSQIFFHGDNSLIYLAKNRHPYKLNVGIHNNSNLNFGGDTYINQTLYLILSEEKNIFIGKGCLVSINVKFRNADPHLIYDAENGERLNDSKSIYIGDHIWIGENVYILKNTQIASGSIIGANTVLSGKKVFSNTVWAGNPCKEVKSHIFWEGSCVHSWTNAKTEKFRRNTTNDYIYSECLDERLLFEDIEKSLNETKSALERLTLLQEINHKKQKNRFYNPWK
ncbi:MAG: acyltransferase [Acetobacter sp.]|nr:acyltransferase [Acetobacter sp.]